MILLVEFNLQSVVTANGYNDVAARGERGKFIGFSILNYFFI
jgi:hypothetical protein